MGEEGIISKRPKNSDVFYGCPKYKKKIVIPCDFGSLKVQVEVLTPLQQAIKLRRVWPIGQNIGPKTNGTPMAMKSDMKLKLSLRSDLSEQNTSRSKLVIHSKTPTQKAFLKTFCWHEKEANGNFFTKNMFFLTFPACF